ncbi:MAG: FHA domain-containing protein [Candidatus Thermoplasmatota archaeon]|nr:FHA domain-containing protein [Candidatus Thermoplasmatota archaeon]
MAEMLWKKRGEPGDNLVKFCPMCDRRYPDMEEFCSKDGHRLYLEQEEAPSGREDFCPSCGRPISPGQQKCFFCGEDVSSKYSDGRLIRLDIENYGVIYIDQFPYDLGRIQLVRHEASPYVNSKHVRFTHENNVFFVQDLKTLNGTLVNNNILGSNGNAKKLEIKDGDVIVLGNATKNPGVRMVFRVLERGKW